MSEYQIISGPYAGRTARGWARPHKGFVAVWLSEGHPHPSALILAADEVVAR